MFQLTEFNICYYILLLIILFYNKIHFFAILVMSVTQFTVQNQKGTKKVLRVINVIFQRYRYINKD